MNILITGVAGFIGSKLSSYLLKNNHNVYGVDNLWKGKFKNIPKEVFFIKGDLYHLDTI